MKTVKIDRKELLNIVKENKTKHLKEYQEAVVDYLKAVLKICSKNLELANKSDISVEYKSLPMKPISFEDSYTKSIRMLELSVDNEIVLTDVEFNQLVMDEWSWKTSFTTSNLMYKSI